MFALILGKFSNLAPDNAAIQSLKGAYEFLARLFIGWGFSKPDALDHRNTHRICSGFRATQD